MASLLIAKTLIFHPSNSAISHCFVKKSYVGLESSIVIINYADGFKPVFSPTEKAPMFDVLTSSIGKTFQFIIQPRMRKPSHFCTGDVFTQMLIIA